MQVFIPHLPPDKKKPKQELFSLFPRFVRRRAHEAGFLGFRVRMKPPAKHFFIFGSVGDLGLFAREILGYFG